MKWITQLMMCIYISMILKNVVKFVRVVGAIDE